MAYHPFRHLGLKFLSIALAVAIWLAVGDQRAVERSVRVPLEFHNLPDGLELVASPPESVEVRLRGPSGTLGRLLPGEVVAVLDLQSGRPGTRLFHMLVDEVRVPYGVHAAQVMPPSISLSFERSVSKAVPVVPAVDGEPAAGYHVGRINANPAVVVVEGPASRVDDLKSATTEPVNVARASADVVERVTVGVADELIRLSQPQSASVTVEIVATPTEKRLEGVSVAVRNAVAGQTVRVVPAAVDVILRGPAKAIADLTTVEAFVDVTGLGRGQFQLPVRVTPLANVEGVHAEPASLDVRIR